MSNVLARAFEDDPVFEWMLPDKDSRVTRSARLFGLLTRHHHFGHGGVEVTEAGHAVVTMTLTTPNCPVAESMPGEVEMRVGAVPGVGSAEVNLVWDPAWDPQKMSDDAKLELGML